MSKLDIKTYLTNQDQEYKDDPKRYEELLRKQSILNDPDAFEYNPIYNLLNIIYNYVSLIHTLSHDIQMYKLLYSYKTSTQLTCIESSQNCSIALCCIGLYKIIWAYVEVCWSILDSILSRLLGGTGTKKYTKNIQKKDIANMY